LQYLKVLFLTNQLRIDEPYLSYNKLFIYLSFFLSLTQSLQVWLLSFALRSIYYQAYFSSEHNFTQREFSSGLIYSFHLLELLSFISNLLILNILNYTFLVILFKRINFAFVRDESWDLKKLLLPSLLVLLF